MDQTVDDAALRRAVRAVVHYHEAHGVPGELAQAIETLRRWLPRVDRDSGRAPPPYS